MAKQPELLLEYLQDGRQTWGYRFYADGVVKEYSDSEMAFEDGKIVTRDIPLAWRVITHLRAAELEEIVQTIHEVKFLDLPEKLGPSKRVHGASVSTWTVNLDGIAKKVIAAGEEATSNPAIKTLREMIQKVTAISFDQDQGHGDKKS